MTAPRGRPRSAPNSGASIRKPRMPNNSCSIGQRLRKHHTASGLAMLGRDQGKKRFGQRTPRRNNKYEKTCRYPNRLNLLLSTVGVGGRSIFFKPIQGFLSLLKLFTRPAINPCALQAQLGLGADGQFGRFV